MIREVAPVEERPLRSGNFLSKEEVNEAPIPYPLPPAIHGLRIRGGANFQQVKASQGIGAHREALQDWRRVPRPSMLGDGEITLYCLQSWGLEIVTPPGISIPTPMLVLC